MSQIYYFDHAATTKMRQTAIEAMLPFLDQFYGNPGSLHRAGLMAKEALENSRSLIASTIGAQARDLIFTGSGTEANNLAILGTARRMKRLGKGNHLITSAIEHPSVRETFHRLSREGFHVTEIPVDENGVFNLEALQEAMRPDTVLVSVMHVNNVVGSIQPIAEIGQIVREHGAVMHCDAVQSYGKIPFIVDQLNVDLLTLNAHKIGGPKGVAALFMRKGARVDPLVYGGGQEYGLRSATENVPGIVAFAAAAKEAMLEQTEELERMTAIRALFLNGLQSRDVPFLLNSALDATLPHYVNLRLSRVQGQALMLELDLLGFATSSGSACSATEHEPSYVLLAMGQSRDVALESLRITFGKTTHPEEIKRLAEAFAIVSKHWDRK